MKLHQGALTIITEIIPEKVNDLIECLKRLEDINLKNRGKFFLTRFKEIHFARWVVLPRAKDAYGNSISPGLVFTSNFDGNFKKHLADLIIKAGDELDKIYCHCIGYPVLDNISNDDRTKFFQSKKVKIDTFYIGAPGRTVIQIKEEAVLRKSLRNLVNQNPHWSKLSPDKIYSKIRNFIGDDVNELAWGLKLPARPSIFSCLKFYWKLISIIIITLFVIGLSILFPFVMLPFVLASLILFIIILRWHEIRYARNYKKMSNNLIQPHLQDPHPRWVQNQFSLVVNIKPGMFTRILLKIILYGMNLLTTYLFTKGRIGGFRTLHFARWIMINNNRRLMFLTNFDGSWENYIGDTSDSAAARQLTAIWSNCMEMAPSKFLIYGGSNDGDEFKVWTGSHQVSTSVWYNAYPGLSIDNVNNNTKVRKGLSKKYRGEKIIDWLRRI